MVTDHAVKFGKVHIAAAVAALLAAIALLVLTGILGVGRGGGVFAGDMRYLYVAGEIWERFKSP